MNAFDSDLDSTAADLLRMCASNGIFLCPVGELEGFFSDVLDRNDKQRWLPNALRLVGKYVVDSGAEPWALLLRVCNYLG